MCSAAWEQLINIAKCVPLLEKSVINIAKCVPLLGNSRVTQENVFGYLETAEYHSKLCSAAREEFKLSPCSECCLFSFG